MRNNRLHITYNASTRSPLITEGLKESFKCNKMTRAADIVGRMNPDIVKEAIFKDSNGIEHYLKTDGATN